MNGQQTISFLHHRATELGDCQALEALGDILSHGVVPQIQAPFHPDALHLIPEPPSEYTNLPNMASALEKYLEAAKLGSQTASAKALEISEKLEKEPSDDLLAAAESNQDTHALTEIAKHKFRKKSKNEAFKLWLKAASLGDIKATHAVSHCFATGQGTSKDMAQALEWQEKAAEMNDTLAIKSVAQGFRALMLDTQHDTDVEELNLKALKWTLKAAEIDDSISLFILGEASSQLSTPWDAWNLCYDQRQGLEYFLRASDAGLSHGLVAAIGVLYELWVDECRKSRRIKPKRPALGKVMASFADTLTLSSSHVRDVFRFLNEKLKENKLKGAVRIRFTGHAIDIVKLFARIEEVLGIAETDDDANEVSEDE